MEDAHSRAYGLAYQQVMSELLKSLILANVLSPHTVQAMLERAGTNLLAKGTEVAAAAATQVSLLGSEVGVTPSQIGLRAN